MKSRTKYHGRGARAAAIALATLFVGIPRQAIAGHPVWPPRPHSAEYRQASALFLRFQDALDAERWQDALDLCSDRVRAKAGEWSSPGAFFTDTVPVSLLLAQDFGYWTLRSEKPVWDDRTAIDGAGFYGLLVPLTEPGTHPVLQWYWAITATDRSWVVDFPPVKLEEFITRKKAALKAEADQLEQIQVALREKIAGVKTNLVPLDGRHELGKPMLFRIELKNSGQSTVDYVDSGVAFAPLTVCDDQEKPLPATELPRQIMVRRGQLPPGASVLLAENVDLNVQNSITRPGKYSVRFSGSTLAIGQAAPGRSIDAFGERETDATGTSGFVTVPDLFPSESVIIEVHALSD